MWEVSPQQDRRELIRVMCNKKNIGEEGGTSNGSPSFLFSTLEPHGYAIIR